jgi:hypothetical protein
VKLLLGKSYGTVGLGEKEALFMEGIHSAAIIIFF